MLIVDDKVEDSNSCTVWKNVLPSYAFALNFLLIHMYLGPCSWSHSEWCIFGNLSFVSLCSRYVPKALFRSSIKSSL